MIEPLTTAQLEQTIHSPGDPVELAFYGEGAEIDGKLSEEMGRFTASVKFPLPPAPYALVARGWLPMPFVLPQRFLVDRNIVASLKSIRTRGAHEKEASFVWWMNLFEKQTGLFNPLLFAYEGRYRRMPTMHEFVAAFRAGAAELAQSFPYAKVVHYEQSHFELAYEQLHALSERGSRDIEFLRQAVPLVVHRVPRKREGEVQSQVLALARTLGVITAAPVVLAVLSILFEDVRGKGPSYGRLLLKPTETYSVEDAYNAVSDLRHIELAALSQSVLPDEPFALCTNDRGLALFWSALKIRGGCSEESLLNLRYSPGPDLFQRLCDAEIKHVLNAVAE